MLVHLAALHDVDDAVGRAYIRSLCRSWSGSRVPMKMATRETVSERALLQRINCKLREDDEVMMLTRSEHARRSLGDI